jgi:hypothetical protein
MIHRIERSPRTAPECRYALRLARLAATAYREVSGLPFSIRAAFCIDPFRQAFSRARYVETTTTFASTYGPRRSAASAAPAVRQLPSSYCGEGTYEKQNRARRTLRD